MKKILILIILLTITVNTYAAVNFGFDGESSNTTYTPGDVNNTTYTPGDVNNTTYTSGDVSNVMMGDSDGAQGAGLGSRESVTFEEFDKKINGNFFTDNKNVPKLSVAGLVFWLVGVLNQLIYVIIGAALVVFLYGILKLSFIDGQKPEAREQARKFMFWGIVSLFVMVSVWGLVKILQATFFNTNSDLIFPMFK